MPVSTARFSRQGRARPSGRRGNVGKKGPNEGPLLIREVTGVTGSGVRHPDRLVSLRNGGSVNTAPLLVSNRAPGDPV